MKLHELKPGNTFKALTTLKVLAPVGRVKYFVEGNPGWVLVHNIGDNTVFLMQSETEVEETEE